MRRRNYVLEIYRAPTIMSLWYGQTVHVVAASRQPRGTVLLCVDQFRGVWLNIYGEIKQYAPTSDVRWTDNSNKYILSATRAAAVDYSDLCRIAEILADLRVIEN
jgi:hypothetical protein